MVSKTLRAEKQELTKAEIDQILLDFHQAILRQCEAWVSDPPLSALEDGQAANFGWRTEEDVVNFAREFPLYESSAWEFQAENLDNAPASELLPALLEHRGIKLSPDSLAFKSLARQAMQVGVATFHSFHKDALSDEAPQRALELLLSRNAHLRDGTGSPLIMPVNAVAHAQSGDATVYQHLEVHTIQQKDPSPLLGAAFDNYIKDKAAAEWGGKSTNDAKTAKRLMLEFFGDIPLNSLSKKEARNFRTALSKLPRLHGKGDFAGLDLQAMVELADSIEEALKDGAIPEKELSWPGFTADLESVKRLSLKTVNKHLTYAKGVFDHAKSFEPAVMDNPFLELHYPKSALAKQASEQRSLWTKEEISALLQTPVWAGCHSEHRRSERGEQIIQDAKFWVPLLGLFAGLRLEEACQLHPENITDIADIPCILVRRGKNQLVKNEASIREIPVHPTLVRLGFLERAKAQQRAQSPLLFPELRRGGPYSLFGYRFSKWFTGYRRTVGLYELGRDFHSFRHSFDTYLQRAGVGDTLVSVLMGHALKGETNGRYFKGHEASGLRDAVEKLDYGEGLGHLFVK